MTTPNLDLSIVVPVYRSRGTLRELERRIREVVEGMQLRYQIIFVEDAGPDDSWSVVEQLCAEHPDTICAIQLMRNAGQHNALMCGFRYAQGEIIITMDDDLQNPPEELPKLYSALKDSDKDLVYGRYLTKSHHSARNLGSTVVNMFYRRVFGSSITVVSFRAIRRPLVQAILTYDLNYTFVDGLLAWNTSRIGDVEVRHDPRRDGASGYTLWRLVVLALNLFTNFSIVPLQIVSLLGLLAAAGGLGTGAFYLVQYFANSISVPGYASTIIVILVMGGIQLLALGMMGEYLGRLHLNMNRKPQYTVRKLIGPEPRAH